MIAALRAFRPAARAFASKALPPHAVLAMPALSPTMAIGNIARWRKAVGEPIAPGDVLVEIETDKATMDFEAQDDGVLAKIIVPDNTKDVPVGMPIAVIVDDAAVVPEFKDFAVESAAATPAPAAADPKPAAAPSQPAAQPTKETKAASSSSDRIFASPVARAIAADLGTSLAAIKGTGPAGRITKTDVEAARQKTPASKPSAAAAPSAAVAEAGFTDLPVSNIRKVIASRLAESKSSIPHFYLTVEINADRIVKLRESLNASAGGIYKLSINDFVVKAAALALKDVPAVNSAWHDSFIRQFNSADIAVAVATESGLITPIVRSAETKGLASISNSIKQLAEKARAGKLAPAEYQGGSFTISNLGMYGIQHFTAIINPPHASILAVGALEDKLVADQAATHGFRTQKTFHVTLSNDHRIVDGAVGAQWLQRFKHYLENPLSMLL